MKFNPQIHHRRSIRLKGHDYSQARGYFVTIATQGRVSFFGEVWDGEMRLNPPGQMVERWWVELAHKFPTVGLGEYAIMPNHFHGVIIIHPENEGAHAGAPVRNEARGIVGADLCVGPVARADPTPRADADVSVDPAAEQGAHTGAPVRNEAGDIVGVDLCVDPISCIDPGTPAAEQGAHTEAQGAHTEAQGAHTEAQGAHIEAQGAHIGAPVRGCEVPLSTIVQWFKTMTTNEYIRSVKQLGWEPFAGKLWQHNYYEHIIRNEADLRRIEEYIRNNPRRWTEDQLHPQAAPNKFNQDR